MSHHRGSVFKNSCLRNPVDPVSKMPRTAYERTKRAVKQKSVDSLSTTSTVSTADRDAEKLKDFYRSIPDYNDINHLPSEQFYSTLKSLRERKKVMLDVAVEHIDECHRHHHSNVIDSILIKADYTDLRAGSNKQTKSKIRRKFSNEKIGLCKNLGDSSKHSNDSLSINTSPTKGPYRKAKTKPSNVIDHSPSVSNPVIENIMRTNRPKRNQSACSISWSDAKIDSKIEIDRKFEQFFEGKRYSSLSKVEIGDEFRTRSMPSSPLRGKRLFSPKRRQIVTVPKPFKMTERDEDSRIVDELRSLRKSFSDDMLHQKCERRQFRANPVPIESRIPLYDKILEDQAMRRAITKINSEAELRAQMKPFNFTKREEKGPGICDRTIHLTPTHKKKKRFKARPFPKNLFSNFFYDKMKENEFFRNMNKRIRAEEMLKAANLPGSMAARERSSRLSTPGTHSDLPVDPSPGPISITSSEKRRGSSPVKGKRRDKKEEFITTSPSPFHFNTAHRAAKKMDEVTKKIYQDSKSSESVNCRQTSEQCRSYSALDLRTAARSNLAAVLRAEAVRRKLEMDAVHRLVEQRRKAEMKQRVRMFKSKPAWHLIKNNCKEDIAMRLQTRRDEEQMRREEFLHEMELMYGRVQQQPMLYERYYAPRSPSRPNDNDFIQLSPRKSSKNKNGKKNCYQFHSPIRSRKVSINDMAETFNGQVASYLNRIDNDQLSDCLLDSDRGANSEK